MQGAGGFIGVVCGLKSEAAAVRSSFRKDPRVRIGVSGADARRAEDIAKRFCAEGAKAIFSIGVSGGLDPVLKPGDLIVAERVIINGGEGLASPGKRLSREDVRLAGLIGNQNKGHQERSVIYGADAIVQSAEEKRRLFQRYRAAAVDMESHGCARAAARAGAPFLAIRAIADPAHRALPPAALGAVASDGSTRVLKTLGAALRDPKQFPELIKLGADSAAATKTLRRELGPMFQQVLAALKL